MTWVLCFRFCFATVVCCWLATAESAAGDPQTEKTVAFSLSGTAKNTDGKPIADATINLCTGPKENLTIAATATSSSDGRFEFKGLQLPISSAFRTREKRTMAGGFFLFGAAPGYGFAWSGLRYYWDEPKPEGAGIVPGDQRVRQGHIDFYQGEPIVIDLDFAPPASLKGRVIDEDNRPLAGARVWLWQADYLNGDDKALSVSDREFTGMAELLKPNERETKTDSGGHFEINGLPAEVCFGVYVDCPDFARASLYAATTTRPITVHHFNQAGITIRNGIQAEIAMPSSREVRPGELTIRIHPLHTVLIDVVEEDTGRPAPDIRVTARTPKPGSFTGSGKTDETGRAVLRLPMGRHELTADPPRSSLYVRTPADLDGTAGRDKEPFAIQLVKGCVVNFEVLDSESGRGVMEIGFQGRLLDKKPTERASLIVQSSTTYIDNPKTDKDGRMRAVMPPGRFQFHAVPQSLEHDLTADYDFTVAPQTVVLSSGANVDLKFVLNRRPVPPGNGEKPQDEDAVEKDKKADDR